MSQNNVYNSLPNAEELDKKEDSANGSPKKTSNTPNERGKDNSESETPNAQDTTGINVTTDAQTKAKKFEFKNLQGELELTPTLKNFSIVRGSTIHLMGVGKYLSGFYYVTSRTVSISGSGAMAIKLNVVKTKFGDSLKGEKPLPEVKTIDTMGNVDGSSSSADGSSSNYGGESSSTETYADGTPVGGGNSSSSSEGDERVSVSYGE